LKDAYRVADKALAGAEMADVALAALEGNANTKIGDMAAQARRLALALAAALDELQYAIRDEA
jgi:hypothetical protein